jgi:hypothetical protein
METSNDSVTSEISVQGSSIYNTASIETGTLYTLPWRKLTPKSSPGVVRIKSSGLINGSRDANRKVKPVPIDPHSCVTGKRTATTTPQSSPSVYNSLAISITLPRQFNIPFGITIYIHIYVLICYFTGFDFDFDFDFFF